MVAAFTDGRRVQSGSGSGDPTVRVDQPDAGLPAQGYRLTIGPEGTTLEHADDAGRRYGLATLAELARSGNVRAGVIEDWPAIAVRAYMLDISRDRVPNRAMLDWLVGVLGRLRVNELQLYTEHTFAWPGHEVVWRDASPLTDDDLSWLRGRCGTEGIALIPCLNGFGHMERFLRHDAYRHRAECPDGAPAMFGTGTVPPTTLAPTQDNADFALALFRRYLEAVPSRLVHIGGDEPFELGRCRSRQRVAAEGRAAVYLEHLRRLIDPLLADGHEVLFWGDLLRTSPEHAAALPTTGVVPVVWHYEAPVPDAPPLSRVLGAETVELLGLPDDGLEGFVAHTRSFCEAGIPFRVAPGTSTWNSVIGRWPNARANIDDAVDTAVRQDALALQLTDWGDNGHHQPPAVSLPPLAHAALAAWRGTAPTTGTVTATVDALAGASGLGADLVALGEVHQRLGVRSMNSSPLFEALLGRFRGDAAALTGDDEIATVLGLFDAAAERWSALPLLGPGIVAASMLARAGIGRLAAAADRPVGSRAEVDAWLRDAVALHEEAWTVTSRPGGAADSVARLTATLA